MMRLIVGTIAAVIVIITIAWSALYFVRGSTKAVGNEAGDLAGRLGGDMARVLNLHPIIQMDRETVIGPAHSALQLVTVKRDFIHEFYWEHQWAGSTKSIRLKGYFTASAGFDLREPFSLNINSKNLTVDLSLPEPSLLACELNDYKVEEDDGWWNKITPEERRQAVVSMVAGAKQSMQKNKDLLREAEHMLKSQVADVIKESGGKPGTSNGIPFSSHPRP